MHSLFSCFFQQFVWFRAAQELQRLIHTLEKTDFPNKFIQKAGYAEAEGNSQFLRIGLATAVNVPAADDWVLQFLYALRVPKVMLPSACSGKMSVTPASILSPS